MDLDRTIGATQARTNPEHNDGCNNHPTDLSLRLTSVTALGAAVPHLLGFHPRESLVLLWLNEGELVVAQRADLAPEVHADVYADAYLQPARSFASTEVIGIVVSADRVDHDGLWAALEDRCAVPLRARLHLSGSQIRDVGNGTQDSGGPWLWVSTEDRQRVQEAGVAPAPGQPGPRQPALNREAISREFDYRPQADERGGEENESVDGSDLAVMLSSDPLQASSDVLRITAFDTPGRDLVMWCGARMNDRDRRELLRGLTAALAATPRGRGAKLAAATAVVAWLIGDGARANAAIDRCLADDPSDVVGRLIDDAVSAGLPPAAIQSMLVGVTLDELTLPQGVVDEVLIGRYSPR